MSDGPNAGNIIAGIFLILFGLFITLLGGGCTMLIVTQMDPVMGSDGLFLLGLSLVTLGVGLSLLYVGIRLMAGGFRR